MAKDCTNVAITKTISTRVSSQCLTLGSSFYATSSKTFIQYKLSMLVYKQTFLDPSVWALG
ncbi:hypothetical protein [Wolbachia endosymbiont (group A) of Anomoia purmunda]|uniref:hypothetical protein n=1 Tax=Wolbachia endosymbiont (group A) of Anomoia purmunda TaxID=2953978 RepID=UPI0022324970|nr:hypothetical protein [Wolbachia endosymbiont (group A) of Anomoia purmunda]